MNDFRIKLLSKILFCILPGLFTIGCKKSGEPFSGPINQMKRYPYERIHLTYEYSGDVRGTEDLFVSGYGKYEARHSKFEMFTDQGLKQSDNGSISRLSDMYKVDYALQKALHEHSRLLDSLYHLDNNDIPSPQAYLESDMKKNYFKSSGIDTVFGKPATKWEQADGIMTLWIWNGLLLRRHATSAEGSLDMKIKEIDTLWTIDTTKFSIPSEFIITNASNERAPNSN
jgi:hypothetical protein